jgi:hypothetical protein
MMSRVRELERAYAEGLRQLWDEAGQRGIPRRTFGELFQIDATIMNLCRLNSFTGLGGRQ